MIEIKDIIKHTVARIRKDYVEDYKAMEKNDFNSGVLLGICSVLCSLKNDLMCLEESCLEDEKNIRDFGLDFDIENEVH